ncbi:hypothetical protein DPMN_056089 [Dreissena polymorpha]|uniref:Uncharacterized protein n=1 Tax=Dreissena polymorpha TaxID=45954 RepID=A0A9D4CSS4_DREPO|nr:hypothetical protein DPMN_056089 [Dreissena polymorpha]
MVTQTHAEIECLRRKLWYLSLGLSDSRRKGATRSTLNPDLVALYLHVTKALCKRESWYKCTAYSPLSLQRLQKTCVLIRSHIGSVKYA